MDDTDSGPYFEDFDVGRVFTGAARTFSADVVAAFAEISGDRAALHTEYGRTRDGRPLVHGPLVLASFFGWHHDLGLSTHVEAAFGTEWDFVAPIHVGDTVTYEMTVTRARRTSGLRSGVIGRHVTVRNQHDQVVQEGRTSALVTARHAVDDGETRLGRSFPTTAWAHALAERLEAAAAFTTATGEWDGTIGLRFGDDTVLFRVYRGRVLECGTRTPHAPTFVLGATDLTWTRLITGPVNDFTGRTMRGEFSVCGSGYEYLRLTSALVALVDEARELARIGSAAPANPVRARAVGEV
ncbi:MULTISPECIES: MaoC/PaaZ C-terminal domain-containing protein [Prauserella salsuginis group]|uniref:MaoC/PaaZ C-terminal domain-containing protein n=2 Tax=Prauserella salsuginis group TaxID=2893672 RepID=A0ABW6GBG1_9PSEU|nr:MULTISPECIES: MaoC/PaaZ C-terminal domain-containing protein [Prauserella salsuginis group]MBB3665688.1 acyl dehydratase/putative sterol carrier protein [Prauserella sediminis]MCR3722880.1 Acyl dehydratase [Prauserella flava]MCR3737445.1 Acyl dehydratase [Prauserella salsuginis]